jgi:ribosomal-protein-alanine N-acetyltransferase
VTADERPVAMVRGMRGEDIAGVVALAAGEPTAPHWPVAEYRRMLEVIAETPSRRGAWVLLLASSEPAPRLGHQGRLGHRRNTRSVGASAGQIAGFAMASHVAGVCDLEAVVVAEVWRGRRFGSSLVEAAAGWGRGLGASRLELEVRASNLAARRLYERMGFAVDGERAGYYRNPEEEAVLMSLRLGE